ncbi:DUF397 domain-containing protein [Actinomadura hibisca]|uniref:DUF397 domain-containing protein n=1 Tax=Actinomadura hibisca TaxID=68565 RepID=UPI00082D9D7E|nr:DUF397 domain-containing protein [Actinomadura hibisca]
MLVDLHGLGDARWRKSGHSQKQECVEVAGKVPGVIAVRDSKDPHGSVLTFAPAAWQAFTAHLKASGHA